MKISKKMTDAQLESKIAETETALRELQMIRAQRLAEAQQTFKDSLKGLDANERLDASLVTMTTGDRRLDLVLPTGVRIGGQVAGPAAGIGLPFASVRVCRVIARPFVGSPEAGFRRTGNRKDLAVAPPGRTLLDRAGQAIEYHDHPDRVNYPMKRVGKRGEGIARIDDHTVFVPGTLPADSGPTCSMPPASTEAIEPPPAPIVSIWIMGERTTKPYSMAVCAANAASPLATSETSKEVPPMSPVITWLKPASLAMRAALASSSAARCCNFAISLCAEAVPRVNCCLSFSRALTCAASSVSFFWS